jgi:hypothetical protein
MEKLRKRIKNELQEAESVTLVPDGWTSMTNTEYLG